MELVSRYLSDLACLRSYDPKFVLAAYCQLFAVLAESKRMSWQVHIVGGVKLKAFEVVNTYRVAVGQSKHSSLLMTDNV